MACSPSTSSIFSGDAQARDTISMPFGGFLSVFDGISAATPELSLYLCQCPILSSDQEIPALLPELADDIIPPAMFGADRLVQANLWMNCLASRSNIHYDMSENVLCVVRGCKTVRLFPPICTPHLHPRAVFSISHNHSATSLEDMGHMGWEDSVADAPRSGRSTFSSESTHYPVVVCLHAGDALYIPEGMT